MQAVSAGNQQTRTQVQLALPSYIFTGRLVRRLTGSSLPQGSPPLALSHFLAFTSPIAHKEMSLAKPINSVVLNLLFIDLMWNTLTKESLSKLRALSDFPRPLASSRIKAGIVTRVTQITRGIPLFLINSVSQFSTSLYLVAKRK